jgi:hypothetical protein
MLLLLVLLQNVLPFAGAGLPIRVGEDPTKSDFDRESLK